DAGPVDCIVAGGLVEAESEHRMRGVAIDLGFGRRRSLGTDARDRVDTIVTEIHATQLTEIAAAARFAKSRYIERVAGQCQAAGPRQARRGAYTVGGGGAAITGNGGGQTREGD